VSRPLSRMRATTSCLTAAALLLAQMPIAEAASAMTRAEYEACQAREEGGFRAAIETLTRNGLVAGLANLDYKALVLDAWRRGNVDDVIDRQVDQAIGEVRDQSSWFDLWSSLASKDKAQELATAAAERVYRSDPIKNVIAELATRIGKEIGTRIELATIDTAGPASGCMQAFLGSRYGATIARIVATGAGKEYAIDASKAGAQISTGQVLAENSEGIAGTVVLVVRRQLSNMASRIGQRIVGAILSRVVAVVAGGVGLVLVAKDIWDFRHGVLPIIADEMKSRESKEKVREELAKSIAEQISDSVKDIAAKTADRVVEIWLEFRRAHAKVVELSGKQPDFQRFLDTVKVDDMARLDEMVGLLLASEGEDGLNRRVRDGTLNRAVTSLPPAALEIARETGSLETALRWAGVAGDSLPKVVELEIHRRAKPEAFTQASLERLIGLKDRLAIAHLASLQPSPRSSLFELDDAALKRVARALDEHELDSLARYATGLDTGPAQRLLRGVVEMPARMAELSTPSVREAVLSSRDQAAAVDMMLQPTTLPNPRVLLAHTRLVLEGRISPALLWAKHAATIVAAAVLLLVLLVTAKRLLFPARARVVVEHVSAAPGRERQRRS
jgi:hypothetical protein